MEREVIYHQAQRERTAAFTPLSLETGNFGFGEISARGDLIIANEKQLFQAHDSHVMHVLNVVLAPTNYSAESYYHGGIYAHYMLRLEAERNGATIPVISLDLAAAVQRDFLDEEKTLAITDNRDIFKEEYRKLSRTNLPLSTGIGLLSSLEASRIARVRPRFSTEDFMHGFKAGAGVVNRAIEKAATSSYFSDYFDWEK